MGQNSYFTYAHTLLLLWKYVRVLGTRKGEENAANLQKKKIYIFQVNLSWSNR